MIGRHAAAGNVDIAHGPRIFLDAEPRHAMHAPRRYRVGQDLRQKALNDKVHVGPRESDVMPGLSHWLEVLDVTRAASPANGQMLFDSRSSPHDAAEPG